ncbi:hypothetical protein E2562_009485 [Oryza meyeriana var. granulata]|uniref:Protein TIFY n=1 Tax=Oryza meyeriana var. granulata TaxID=110450 RepID=A0A6G1BU83_9ORYZ|nr:hypothetical protein E2562_009485 [Oryza meyeriana var. granulata]
MAGSEQRPVARAAAAGSGSRFAVTCGLLRQYMKEHGGSNGGGRLLPAVTAMSLATGADAAVGAAAAEEVEAPEERKTMELFPQQAGTLKDSQERKETEKAQLTIFYGGSVVVFDDFPAEKVDELMKLAGSCDTAAVSDAGAAAACELSPGQPCLPACAVCLRFCRHAHRQEGVAAEVPGEEEEQAHRDGATPGGFATGVGEEGGVEQACQER